MLTAGSVLLSTHLCREARLGQGIRETLEAVHTGWNLRFIRLLRLGQDKKILALVRIVHRARGSAVRQMSSFFKDQTKLKTSGEREYQAHLIKLQLSNSSQSTAKRQQRWLMRQHFFFASGENSEEALASAPNLDTAGGPCVGLGAACSTIVCNIILPFFKKIK